MTFRTDVYTIDKTALFLFQNTAQHNRLYTNFLICAIIMWPPALSKCDAIHDMPFMSKS